MPIAVEHTIKCYRIPIGGVHLNININIETGVDILLSITIIDEVVPQVSGTLDEIGVFCRALPLQGIAGRGWHRSVCQSPPGSPPESIRQWRA